ncbi:hypothetical protein FGO68_gene8184 [Halteria grandinella]|uniref:Uncharacterized protein n=1 Tax=Halteria grandinella TaxID=5974 RepID=A0A8J8TAV4_HALGN|nr:hypothetical protein FGO68_gene8184 [Halteria grandinella]
MNAELVTDDLLRYNIGWTMVGIIGLCIFANLVNVLTNMGRKIYNKIKLLRIKRLYFKKAKPVQAPPDNDFTNLQHDQTAATHNKSISELHAIFYQNEENHFQNIMDVINRNDEPFKCLEESKSELTPANNNNNYVVMMESFAELGATPANHGKAVEAPRKVNLLNESKDKMRLEEKKIKKIILKVRARVHHSDSDY